MATIAIIGALEKEVAQIKEELSGAHEAQEAGLTVVSGELDGLTVVATTAGMGTVNAAAATQHLISKYAPQAVVFSGIAGGLNPKLHINDVVIGKCLRYLDTDTALIAESAPGLEEFVSTPALADVAAAVLAEHGFVDAIVERKNLKITLNRILKMHHSREGFADFDPLRMDDNYEPTELMRERAARAKGLTPWEKVKAARKVDRPSATDYMENIFDEFMEFHGDRYFRDDPAIVGGVAYLDDQPVTVIGIQKGKDFKDCMKHNYGMPSPEGYRKAIRLMKQAEKFGRAVITFVNTAGAYCGMEAEERGQGEAIARNLYEMSALKVPVLCIMIGEGGSGGALALAVGNEVWMMENATYCVLSPEGFASILWKDGKRAKEASEIMKITALDLKSLGVIEQIIPEYGVADAKACESISRYLKGNIKKFLEKQNGKTGEQFASERYARFRKF